MTVDRRMLRQVERALRDLERRGEVVKRAGRYALGPPKNPDAVALGRLGGPKGGKARAVKLSAARRREISRAAARARWGPE